MDRALTRILLAQSNVESTTPATDDGGDWFSRWATPEVYAASTHNAPALTTTREVVDTTPPVTGRQRSIVVGAMSLSYNDLKRGCVSRTTFQYVPNSGVYLTFKAAASAARVNLGKQRRQCGLGRYSKTKLTQSVDEGGAISWLGSSCDDHQTSARRRVDTFLQQQRSERTNQASCNDNNDLATQRRTSIDLQSQLESRNEDAADNEAATCCGDVDCTDEQTTTKQEQQQRSDSRQVKTWLYNFLPPIATTTQLGRGDADTSRENSAEVRAAQKSRAASGRISRGRCPSDGRHPVIIDGRRKQRALLDDELAAGAARRRQRQLTSPASDDVHAHSHQGGQRTAAKQTAIQVDGRRRRQSSDLPTDDYQNLMYFTDTCLLPHCDCRHHHVVYSDHEDEPTLTGRICKNDDDDDCGDEKTDGGSTDDDTAAAAAADGDDDNDDDEEEEEAGKEATKSARESFNPSLSKLDMKQSSEQQLQLGLTARIIDIHRRRRQKESCKS